MNRDLEDTLRETIALLVKAHRRNHPEDVVMVIMQGLVEGLNEGYRMPGDEAASRMRSAAEMVHRQARARYSYDDNFSRYASYGFDPGAGAKKKKAPPPPPPPDPKSKWWEVLGVPQHATKAAIRAAWRNKMKAAHPDKGGDSEMAKKFNMAKDEGIKVARA